MYVQVQCIFYVQIYTTGSEKSKGNRYIARNGVI